ncbi:MAG: 50S ribosomal protein L18 [Planctomycetota bacterium]
MKSTVLLKNKRRDRRAKSVRRRIAANSDRPRLSIHRTTKHISAQVIDDVAGSTLCALSSTSKKLADQLNGKTKTEKAAVIGAEIARLAKEKNVTEVVLDRGYSRYHGRVKALADAAREAGLTL